MPGILYVVATPIGNLEDITLRALRVLREVDLIAAEDTRRTARLLQHYSISTPTTSLHEHNERTKAPQLVERLRAGSSVAVVSDAGTPGVSDPGSYLVLLAREASVPVVPVPGASAVMAIVAGSGLAAGGFSFLGFPPYRSKALSLWIQNHLVAPERAVVFYEAPHRIGKTLAAMLAILGDRPILVGREVTKLHEELAERPISEHLVQYRAAARGEFVVMVGASTETQTLNAAVDEDDICIEFGRLTENGLLSTRAAARQIAESRGLSTNTVYEIVKRIRC